MKHYADEITIEADIKKVIIKLKLSIESAEMYLKTKTCPPLTVCFLLWSDIRDIEKVLKKHDPVLGEFSCEKNSTN